MADESTESPWGGDEASYRAVPPINPKTEEPVKQYVCMNCGVAVLSRKIHSAWHRRQHAGVSWP